MKIGFLAMSGLRVYDPRLLELGMTLPGIQERGRVLGSLPSLGLLYCLHDGSKTLAFRRIL